MSRDEQQDIVDKAIKSTPRTLMGILIASCVATFLAAVTYGTIRQQLSDQTRMIADLSNAVNEIRTDGTSDRYRGKDADRTMGMLFQLNRGKFPELLVPVPTSVRDGKVETFR